MSDAKFLSTLKAKILATVQRDPSETLTEDQLYTRSFPPETRDRIKIACDLAQKAIDEWTAKAAAGEHPINKERARQLDAFAVRLGHLAVVGLERAFWETVAEVAGDVLYVAIRQAQM